MLTPLLPPLSATPRPHGHSLASCYSRGKNPNKVPESATGRFLPSTPTRPPALPRLRGAAAASFLPASQEGGALPTAGPLLMLPALLPELSPSPRASRVAATPHVGASRGPARLPDQVPSSCYRSPVQPVLPLAASERRFYPRRLFPASTAVFCAALEAPQGAGPGRSVSCGAQRSAQRLTHIVGAKERSGVEEIAPRPLPKHEAPWRMRPWRTGAGWGRRGTWRSARRQGRSEHRGIVSRDVP